MNFEKLDPAILAALPPGSKLVSVVPHGATRWSIGLKVAVEVKGTKMELFIKIIERKEWTAMAKAEFEAQTALAAIIPENVVVPMACGTFEHEAKAFFMTKFRYLRPDLPPPLQLVAILKRLHQTSVSPSGKFGFHTTTYWGPPPMVNNWTDNWEEYYTRQFRSDVEYAQNVHSKCPELDELAESLINKVIPRLLRPLQTGGRSIKPSLCHGDLWDGNVQYDVETEKPILFDSCAFYGHNEVDLQAIGDPRYLLGMEFVDMYKNEVGASEPEEDFYDRHDLYGIRNNVVVAAICPEQVGLLEKAKDTMRELIAKFPDGFEGFKDKDISSS